MRAVHNAVVLGSAGALLITFAPTSGLAAQAGRDSAGTRIVENAAPLSNGLRAPRLAATPMLDLDPASGGDYTFGGVAAVVRLADGRIFVAARTAPQFRLFDAEGRLVHAISERGIGDKANADRHQIARLDGDTIGVVHSRDMLLFVVAGDSIRQLDRVAGSVQGQVQGPENGPPRELLVHVLGDGGSATMNFPTPPTRAAGTQWTDSTGLQLRDRKGTLVRDLGRMPYVQLEATKDSYTSVWLSAIGVSCAGAGRFYYGFGNEYAIRAYSANGNLERIIRRAWKPAPVTGADWERWVVEWSKLWVKKQGADSLKEVQEVRESPYASELPAFSACLVAKNGNLWVRDAHLDDAISAGSFSDDPIVPSKWSVFNPAGGWIGDVTMPAFFQPMDADAEYVTGRLRKGPGRVAVVVYRITPGPR